MNQSIIKISLITKKILHELLVWVYPKYCINNKCNYKNKNTKIKCPDLVKVTNYIGQVNCVFATKSKFIIPISLQPAGVNIDFLISEAKKKYLNQGLRLWIEKSFYKIKVYGTDSIPLFSIIKNNSNKSKFIAKNVDGSTKLNLHRRVQLAICSTAFPSCTIQ